MIDELETTLRQELRRIHVPYDERRAAAMIRVAADTASHGRTWTAPLTAAAAVVVIGGGAAVTAAHHDGARPSTPAAASSTTAAAPEPSLPQTAVTGTPVVPSSSSTVHGGTPRAGSPVSFTLYERMLGNEGDGADVGPDIPSNLVLVVDRVRITSSLGTGAARLYRKPGGRAVAGARVHSGDTVVRRPVGLQFTSTDRVYIETTAIADPAELSVEVSGHYAPA